VPVESVITAQDASSIYEVPLNLEKEGLAQQTLELFNLSPRYPHLEEWENLIRQMQSPSQKLEIAIVGK